MVIIGCGQLGSIFARVWREREPDDAPICTVRHESSCGRLEGFDVRVVDLLRPETFDWVRGESQVLVSVSSGTDGEEVWARGIDNLVAILDPSAHVVHISSTGVYSEADGGEVDEESPLVEGSALVLAERALQQRRSTVLRCSGLVGEARGPQRMLDRLAGHARPDGWLNLVWMDDVVRAVVDAFDRAILGTFNVSGGAMRRSDFYDPLLRIADLEPIRWEGENPGRRVRCDRLEATFGAGRARLRSRRAQLR
jgi:nucleoside-diphosphate-sugar epimerase